MDLRKEFFKGLDLFADTVERVGNNINLPSACAEWDLSGVVAHERNVLLNELLPAVTGAPAGNAPGAADALTLADQWAVVDLQVTTAMEEAKFDDGDMAVTMATLDLFLHAWDISWGLAAAGHGERVEFDEETVKWLDDFLQAAPEEKLRVADGFGPPTEAPDGATATEKVMAFAGRTV
ncbi:DinB family protein [Arthrobacter monumenti]